MFSPLAEECVLMPSDLSYVKFRASSVGKLLVGGNAITNKQLDRLDELEARKASQDAKPLTAKMEEELAELIAKRDGEFEFGATALSCIRDLWLKNEFGYEEPLFTNELLKGIVCEAEAISLLSRYVPGGKRYKNEERYEDAHFIGTPDIVGDECVEDVKCSWTLRTFLETERPDPIYYAQAQVYMALTGRSEFRLSHVLIETPFEIVEEEKKRFYFRFNCDEENPYYIKAVQQIDSMNDAIMRVPVEQRVKCFRFQRDDQYLDLLRTRVEQARRVYAFLKVGGSNE